MSQQLVTEILTFIYTASSCLGVVLFFYTWRLTREDRVQVSLDKSRSRREHRLECLVARRNEIVAGVLTITLSLRATVGMIAVILAFEIFDLPWEPGLVAAFLLVAANFLEMLIGVALIRARRAMNADHEPRKKD